MLRVIIALWVTVPRTGYLHTHDLNGNAKRAAHSGRHCVLLSRQFHCNLFPDSDVPGFGDAHSSLWEALKDKVTLPFMSALEAMLNLPDGEPSAVVKHHAQHSLCLNFLSMQCMHIRILYVRHYFATTSDRTHYTHTAALP